MGKYALISVYDKTGLLEFLRELIQFDYSFIATGGTYNYLISNAINCINVSDVTEFPEILDGRVKTLHPKIFGGILAKSDNQEHLDTLIKHNIQKIDMVVVNLYPFFEHTQDSLDVAMEYVDIGGVALLRAGAKAQITVADVSDYSNIIKSLQTNGSISEREKRYFAGKAFNLTSGYDGAISKFLLDKIENTEFPQYLQTSHKKQADLRYGENPHQKAAYYVPTDAKDWYIQLHGKELSFNNLKDIDIAWRLAIELNCVSAVGVKHATPCGVAVADTVFNAYQGMYSGDKISIFGGVVAINGTVDEATAFAMNTIFLEVIIANSYTDKALLTLKEKKNLRIIQVIDTLQNKFNYTSIANGILVQTADNGLWNELTAVTDRQPTDNELSDMKTAMTIAKYVQSNGVVTVKNSKSINIGGGQTNRLWSTQQALARSNVNGAVLASDGFFPFRDSIDECAKYGITAVIQPGGSMRDKDVIDACNENNVTMIFTNMRHFKH